MKVVILVAATSLFAAFVAAHVANDHGIAEEKRIVDEHVAAACGTVHSEPPAEHLASLAEFSKRHLSSFQPVTLDVIVHISWNEYSRAKSYIPYRHVAAAFAMANKVLSGTANGGSVGTGLAFDTGFQLNVHEVKYYEVVVDGADGTLGATAQETLLWQAKQAVDPTKYINVWVTDTGASGGRVDHMPWKAMEGGESNPHWGWIQNWGIFPHDNYDSLGWPTLAKYNTGDSLAHEFGHFLGLYHSFSGGCYSLVGDYVDDTPGEREPFRGTCRNNKMQVGNNWRFRDSCTNQPGNDDISNIMDYSYDSCRDHFTAGQAAVMQAAIMMYKPKLYAHSLANSGRSTPATDPPTASPTYPAPSNAVCTTIGGANKMIDGTQCAIPFRFKGKTYNGCASIAANDEPYMGKYKRKKPTVQTEDNFWCPTISKYSSENMRQRFKWGYCVCGGASQDDMLQSSVGRLEDYPSVADEYEGEDSSAGGNGNSAGSTTEKQTNGGATAAIAVLVTLGTLMVVGLAGVAMYYRQRLNALRGNDGTYQKTLGSQEMSDSKSQQSFVLSGADNSDASLSEI